MSHFRPTVRPFCAVVLSAATLLAACSDRTTAPQPAPDESAATSRRADPLFVNPGFEAGTLNGWQVTTGLSNKARLPVLSEDDLLIAAGGNNLTSAKTGTVMSLVPPGLTSSDSVRYPRYGVGAAVVNELGKNRNVNRLIQTAKITPKDIDPHDGKVHVRFVVLPVMQNPGHVIQEQPYYFVSVSNVTRGTTLASRFNFSNESGVPWRSNAAGDVVYTDWLLFDLPIGPADAAVGDTLEVRVIAGGCQPTGHWGHAIVDAFGTTIPGLAVFAAGPQSVAAGSDYQYRYRVNNGGGEVANGGKLTIHLPADTTFRSVDTPGVQCKTPVVGVRGSITCELPSVPAGGYFDVRMTVRADATASSEIRHGWYTVESARETSLIGPLVTTRVTPAGSTHYVDLSTRVTNGQPALEWGQPVLYAVTVRNAGPATATEAPITSNLPAELANVTWTCSPSAGAECGALSGAGALATTATLPPGSEVSYTVSANVTAGTGPGQVSYRVVAAAPVGSTEQHPDDNGDADTDPVNTLRTVTLQKTGSGTGRLVATPGDVQCGAGCTQTTASFAEGTVIAFHAVAEGGSRFAGWSGACSGTEVSCTVTVAAGQTVTAAFEPNPIAISSPLTATAAVGLPFEYTLTAIGQYTGLDATGRPAWLGYDAATSKLTGTAPAAGTFNVTLSVTDGTVTRTETLVITAGVPPRITSALTFTLATSTTAWTTISVAASGTGPIHYNASNLPGLVAFNSTNGAFSGTSGAVGTFNVPVVAQNAFGSDYRILAVSIGGAPVITSALTATATVGAPFSYTLTATGSPVPTRSVTQLPAWASFNATTGVISGTPTHAGTFSIGLRATNTGGTSQQALMLTVDGPAVITSGLTASATVGQPFSYTLTAEGTAPITRTMSGLPAWATFDAGSGIVSGTPTAPGTLHIPLGASNGIGQDARTLTLTISLPPPPPSPPVITSALSVSAVAGEPFTYVTTATGLQPITLAANSLPTWAAFDPATGTLSGTPPAEATHTVSLGATNVLGQDDRTLTITVREVPRVTSALDAEAVVGELFSYTFTASGTQPQLDVRGLPAWASFDPATGLLSGIPTAEGGYKVALDAVNPAGYDIRALLIIVRARPLVTSSLAVDAVVGQPFTYAVTASGTEPQLSVNGLPQWLSFDSATGVLSGVPTADGLVNVTLQASNPAGTDTRTLNITVRAMPVVTSALAVDAVVGQPFAYTLTASGTAPQLSVSGLPQWLSFDEATGQLTGIPHGDGVFAVGLEATNPAGTDQKTLLITVRTAPQITSSLAVDAVVGQPFTYGVTASGTAPVISVSAPQWLSFDAQTGALTGTPSAEGVVNVTLQATNPAGIDTRTLVITVRTVPVITSALTADAVVGQPFSYTLTASGTQPQLSVNGLPQWLTFNPATGVLSGTPTTDAFHKVALEATNPAGQDIRALLITVRTRPAITSALAVDAVVGQPFTYGITASGTEPQLTAASLPQWLHFDAQNNLLTGTPQEDGSFSIALNAANAAGSDTRTLVITVRTTPVVTSALTADAVVGQPFSYTLTASGTQPQLSVNGLPQWLAFNPATGVLSGTPTADDFHKVALEATNPAGQDIRALLITVRTRPAITSALAVDAVVGQPFTYGITASGTEPQLTAASMPQWLHFDAQNNLLTGTPQEDGSFSIALHAANAAGSDTRTLVITVRTTPVVTSALAVDAVVGQPFGYTLTASGTQPQLSVNGLPQWLSFDPATGLLTGTPLSDGSVAVGLRATNPAGSDQRSLVITVRSVPQITSALTADAVVGDLFTYALTASGTQPTLGITALPSWAQFDPTTGILSGTPDEEGTLTLPLSATNPAGSSQETLTVTVRTKPQLTSALQVHAAVGSPFRYTLTATGTAPIILDVTGLPPGLTFTNDAVVGISSAGRSFDMPTVDTIRGTPSAAGAFLVTLSAQNAAGLDTKTLQLDVRPAVSPPGVGAPLPGESLDVPTPTLTGTTSPQEAGGSVTVTGPGGQPLCTATIASDGTWSCTLPPLAEGPHTVTITVTDPNGVPGTADESLAFEIDLTAPALSTWSAPAENAKLNDPSPLLTGTAEPLAQVRVFQGTGLVCSTSADASGGWSCLPLQPLPEGTVTLTVRALDRAGNVSPGADRSVVIDLTAPNQPVLQQPLDGAHITTGTPTLTGVAEPLSEVTVRIDGEVLCVVTADVTGHFSCDVGQRLLDGPHTVTLIAKDDAGNDSLPGESVFTVDTVNPGTPKLTQPRNAEILSNRQPLYVGTGEPHSVVTLMVDGTLACTALVAEDGSWSCAQPFPLADGLHRLALTATDRSGRPSAPGTSTFTVDTLAPALPTIDPVGKNGLVSIATPRFSGTAEPRSPVDVRVDGQLVCTAQTDAAGKWSCTSTVALADGAHEVTATSTDAAGNESPEAKRNFRIDTTAPAQPAVSAPRTDGGLITDPLPTFGGTAEPGSEITVRVDGEIVCTAIADPSGAWTCTPSQPIEPGPRSVSIEVKDEAGNVSDVVTGNFDLRTERGQPVDPSVDGTVRVSTNNGRVTGTATPGSTVVVYVDGVEVGRTQADEQGNWSFTLPLLGGGEHSLEIGVLDAEGREVHRTGRAKLSVKNPDITLGGGVGCTSTGGGGSFLGLLIAGAALLRSRRFLRSARVTKAGAKLAGLAMVAVLTALLPGAAGAQPRVEGFELEQLTWNPAARGGLLVGGADLNAAGEWRMSASLGYQNSPLKYVEEGVSRATLVEHRWTTVFGGAYAVNRWLELSGWVPVVAYQNGATVRSELGEVVVSPVGRGMGLGTPWLQGRVGLLREVDGSPIDLGLGLGVGLPLGSSALLTRDPSVALAPRVGAGKRVGSTRVALELGGVVKPKTAELLTELDGGAIDRIGSRFEAGVGVTSLGAGLRGELSARLQVPLAGQAPNVEVLAGARFPIAGMQLFALAGPGFGNSPGTPAVRAIAGVSFDGGKRDLCREDSRYPIEQCPHLDADRDGVLNGDDACPLEAAVGTPDGCPIVAPPVIAPVAQPVLEPVIETVPAPEPVVEEPTLQVQLDVGQTIELREKVHFDTGKASIQTRSHGLLREVAQVLLANPQLRRVLIEGHTDSRGSAVLNRRLSDERARAVRDFLIAEGVEEARLSARGHGPDRPIADNATREGREQNRRVELRIAEVE